MKVGLWAEIRRLAEIEKLSARVISRRLHCSWRTVAQVLELEQPPARSDPSRVSRLDPYKAKIDALLAKYPELSAVRVHEEIARGPDGYTGSVITVRRYVRSIRPARGRVYQEVHYEPAQAMQVDWGECGRVPVGNTTPQSLGLGGRALLQPDDLYRVHPLAAQGGILSLPGACPGVLWGQSSRHHLRQLENGRDQRLGPRRLFSSRVPGAVWPLLLAADRLRTA